MEKTIQLEQLSFYSFFTKHSLMEEYGFSSGLLNRLFRKVIPTVPDSNTLEFILLNEKDAVPLILSNLNFENLSNNKINQQLDLSIKALCSKVITFGLDNNIKAKFDFLELNTKPFESLIVSIVNLNGCEKEKLLDLINLLETIEQLIIELRKNKKKIGTNFHLTLTTRRILEYAKRTKELLYLKLNINSKKHWEKLFIEFIEYAKYKNSLRLYIRRHSDLVALEIVEHTSNKGIKYIAENRKEYWNFFFRSLLGGGIIAIFALLKIIFDSYELTQLQAAFLFSVNYALCFIIVKQFGGIIATKQPAMTASTLAKNIDTQDDLKIDSIKDVSLLVRKVFRSQFISIIGNFLMALLLASIIMYSFQQFGSDKLIKIVNSEYLIKNVVPSTKLICFAAIAGFFLALTGLISGYIDNKVVASKIGYRIRNNNLFLKSNRIAVFLEKKAGALFGNVCLGFFLGSSFLLNNILPFSVDIRHIAFSSANIGYAIINYSFDFKTILLAISGALLIGLINLIVSFSFTLFLALKSRGAELRLIPKIIFAILKDFIQHPLHYFINMNDDFSINKNDKKTLP